MEDVNGTTQVGRRMHRREAKIVNLVGEHQQIKKKKIRMGGGG
jgi:hypothetical protein